MRISPPFVAGILALSLIAISLLMPVAAQAQYSFTNIADNTGPFVGPSSSSINATGVVSFTSNLKSGGEGVFVGSGGPVTTIATTTGGLFSSMGGWPSINDTGVVAFFAYTLPSGVPGIFVGSGGAVSTIANGSLFSSGLGAIPSINSSGKVAFFSGGGGIYTSSDGRGLPITPFFSDFHIDGLIG